MAIEKGLYAAPEGLEALAAAEPDIEIEIEDPEAVHIGVSEKSVFPNESLHETPHFQVPSGITVTSVSQSVAFSGVSVLWLISQ